MRSKLLAPAGGVFLLGVAAGALAQSGDVEIKDAWARATPGGAKTGAVYATIVSPGGDRLTGVKTAAADKAEIHSSTTEGGVMKMRQVEGLDLPAGQKVTLKPGGYHIMLTGLGQPLKEGQSVTLTFSFARAGAREVAAAIQKVGAMAPGNSPEHAHGGTDMRMKH